MAHRFSSQRWSKASSSSARSDSAHPDSTTQRGRLHPTSKASSSAPLFGCLLLPHFPVWAARFVSPSLGNSPLLIHRKGKVTAACPQSLTAGVKIGWALQRAQSLCPSAALRAESPCEIAYAWSEVLAALYGLTPHIESSRPGLLFFEPPSPGSSTWLSTMATLAKLVKCRNAQAALAPDRATAELAAHTVAPGMIRRITSSTSFLQQAPSGLLTELGLSLSAAERLEWFGFHRVSDLSVLSREQLASQFADPTAPRDATLLWRFARAGTAEADRQPVQSYVLPRECKSRLVFEQAATCPAQWEGALADALQQAVAQLNGLRTGVLSLQLETNQGPRMASKILREPLANPRSLFRVAQEQAAEALNANNEKHSIEVQGVEVQAIEVALSHLMADGGQETLFDTRRYDSSPQRQEPPTLIATLRNLEARHVGTLWKWRLRDQYAPLPEERFALAPALDESL